MRISKAGACNEHGFTLIELAMVLLVIGIAAAVAMPRVAGMLDRQQMRRTLNTLRGTVRYLQANAAMSKHVYRLTFDLDHQTLSPCRLRETRREEVGAQSREEVCEPVLRPYRLPDAVRIVDVIGPQGEKIREGEAHTHFHPTGLAEPSIVHFRGDRDRQMTLQIQPLAGRIRVFDGYVEPETS